MGAEKVSTEATFSALRFMSVYRGTLCWHIGLGCRMEKISTFRKRLGFTAKTKFSGEHAEGKTILLAGGITTIPVGAFGCKPKPAEEHLCK